MTQDERRIDPLAAAKYSLAAVARLVGAARRLYLAGTWTTPGLPPAEQADLWMELRDALGLPPGTATATGSGSYVCKICGIDEIQARAEGCSFGPCPMELRKPTTLRAITETPAPIPEFALGSNKFPAVIDLHDGMYMVQLGTVVAEAFKLSGYHIKAWNAISQDSRDIYIERAIRRMRSAAGRT